MDKYTTFSNRVLAFNSYSFDLHSDKLRDATTTIRRVIGLADFTEYCQSLLDDDADESQILRAGADFTRELILVSRGELLSLLRHSEALIAHSHEMYLQYLNHCDYASYMIARLESKCGVLDDALSYCIAEREQLKNAKTLAE